MKKEYQNISSKMIIHHNQVVAPFIKEITGSYSPIKIKGRRILKDLERLEQNRNKRNNVILFNIETGVYYSTISEASELLGIGLTKLKNQLKGVTKNKTNLIIV